VLSSLFIYPAVAQLDCSKRMSQFTLKFTLKCSYMFRFYNHHQGSNVREKHLLDKQRDLTVSRCTMQL